MSTATHQPMPDPIPAAPKRGRRKAAEAAQAEAKPETEKPKRGRPRKNPAEPIVEAAVEAALSGDPELAETLVEAAVLEAGTAAVVEAVEGAAEAEIAVAADTATAPVVATFDPREPEAVVQVAPGSTPYVDPYTRDLKEWRRKLQTKSAEVKEHRATVESIKLDLKEAKKVLEADLIEFERLVDSDPEKNPLPLFDPPKPAEKEPFGLTGAGGEPPRGVVAAVAPADAWRSDDIASLDLAIGVREKLRSAGIDTIGALSDFVAPNKAGYCKRYVDIEGVGAATAEKIEEAMMRYWETRPTQAAPPVVDAPAAADAVDEVDPGTDDDFEIDEIDEDDEDDPFDFDQDDPYADGDE